MEFRIPRSNQRRLIAVGVAVIVLVALLWTLRDREGGLLELQPRADSQPFLLGWHEQGDNLDRMRAHEERLGKRFALVRLYNQWQLPGRRLEEMVSQGRLVLSSHKAPDSGWGAVASGREDKMIRALAERYKSYRTEIVFVFHHEPHDDASDLKGGDYGTSRQFVDAWRRIHRIFGEEGALASRGGNVLFGYVATGSQALAEGDGAGDRMYPGDEYVDLLAHDRYNWADCRKEKWEEFATNWEPLVRLAAAHHKPIIPAELGSGPGGDRDEWFRNAAEWLKNDPQASRYMLGFAYYHSFHDNCHWDFMNDGDGVAGWRDAFSDDPRFLGEPFSLAGVVAGLAVP